MIGCTKRYTDPSSLRKHIKNHSAKEQQQARRKTKFCQEEKQIQEAKLKYELTKYNSQISIPETNYYTRYNFEPETYEQEALVPFVFIDPSLDNHLELDCDINNQLINTIGEFEQNEINFFPFSS